MQSVSSTPVPIFAIEPGNASGQKASNAEMPTIAEEASETSPSALPCTDGQGGCEEHCHECYERTRYCVRATLTNIAGFAQKKEEHLAKQERKSSRAKAWKAWEHQELYLLTAETFSNDWGANDNQAQAQEDPRAHASNTAHRRIQCWE